jgi:galactokinase/mevalonate kinase-like predicted kinase
VTRSIEVSRISTSGEFAELEQDLPLYFAGFARTASEITQEQLRLTPQRTRELQTMLGPVDEVEEIVRNATCPLSGARVNRCHDSLRKPGTERKP